MDGPGHQVQYGCVLERGMCCWCGLGAPGANLNVAAVSVQISSISGLITRQINIVINFTTHQHHGGVACTAPGPLQPAWHELTWGSREAGKYKDKIIHGFLQTI